MQLLLQNPHPHDIQFRAMDFRRYIAEEKMDISLQRTADDNEV
jgi:hypothetical protein